jgi:hypothetical protein
VGAALAVVDELFAPDHLRSWIDYSSPARHVEAGTAASPRRDAAASTRPARRPGGSRSGAVTQRTARVPG